MRRLLSGLIVLSLVGVALADHVYERGIALVKKNLADGARDSMEQAKMDAGGQRYDYNDTIGDIEELDCGDCPNYPTCATLRQQALWEGADGETDLGIGLGKQLSSDQAWAAGNREVGAGDIDAGKGLTSLAEAHYKTAQTKYDEAKTSAAPDEGAEAEFVRAYIHYRDGNEQIEEIKACEVCYGD